MRYLDPIIIELYSLILRVWESSAPLAQRLQDDIKDPSLRLQVPK